jgi:hypothetical protein
VARGEQAEPLPTEQVDVMKIVQKAYESFRERREVGFDD